MNTPPRLILIEDDHKEVVFSLDKLVQAEMLKVKGLETLTMYFEGCSQSLTIAGFSAKFTWQVIQDNALRLSACTVYKDDNTKNQCHN